nr:hypothetical protein [Candidatus Erwinia haradaeae]
MFGKVLHLNRMNIWTDMLGICITNPDLVSSAKFIEEIKFKEVVVMIMFDVKILHSSTLIISITQ